MPTLFTRIINGEIPSHKLAEDENFYAFLDVFPLVEGHALVIPKKEIDYYFDMDDELMAGLHIFSKKIAHAIKEAIPCKKVGTTVIGLEVPHAHLHLIPMNNVSDMDFSQPKLQPTQDELKATAEKIREKLNA